MTHDASYSRTYLTRHNYRGPQLLGTIRGRSTADSRSNISISSSAVSLSDKSIMRKRATEEMDELDIYAQPMSSEDEQEKISSATTVKAEPKKRSSPLAKRSADTAAASRSKRRRIKDDPSTAIVVPDTANGSTALPIWEMPSSGSQKRKHKSYANRKTFQDPEPIIYRDKPDGPTEGFVNYGKVKKHEDRSTMEDSFKLVDSLPIKGARINHAGRGISRPRGGAKGPDFAIPDLPDTASSAATSASDIPPLFEDSFSVDVPRRERSGSTSSLSSADSMFILTYQDDGLDEGLEVAEEDTRPCCPVCRKRIQDSAFLCVPHNLSDLRSMPFSRQQEFCNKHQMAEAKEQWRKRKYPLIDWLKFEKTQIPREFSSLKRVLNRQVPSFYLDELDARIKSAAGNRRKLKSYLNEGAVDVAKYGYYGPKGARIVVSAITEALTQEIKEALQGDATLRQAGVGAYVSAVLAPELTLRLVMDDMGLKTPEEGRAVLGQSSEVGALLYPDDDHIEEDPDGEYA